MAVETLTSEDVNMLLEVLDSKMLVVQERIQALEEEEEKGIQCSAHAQSSVICSIIDFEDETISLSELLMDGPNYGMGIDALLLQLQPWGCSDETRLYLSHMLMDKPDYRMGLDPFLQPQPWDWKKLCNGAIEEALPPLMDHI